MIAAHLDVSSQLSPRLFANVAGRAERHSDFGNACTARLSAIYEVSNRLAVCGTVSSNLRTPALSRVNFSDRTINSEDRTLVNTVTLRAADPLSGTLGVDDLDEESARNVSLGKLVGVEEVNTIEDTAPRRKGVAPAAWAGERWRLLTPWRYYGSTVRAFNFGGGFEPRQRSSPEVVVRL